MTLSDDVRDALILILIVMGLIALVNVFVLMTR